MPDIVLTERRDSIAILTLNEPERLNPISDDMRASLLQAAEAAMNDPAVRAVVVTGAGGNFSSGADMRQIVSGNTPDPARSLRRMGPLHKLIMLMAGGPKPVVAAVEGGAFGAGMSIALAADYIIAAEGARLGAAFARVGLTADCGLLWTLPPRIGLAKAKDMMFTGRPVDAAEALALGMVDKVVAKGGALAAALEKAKEYLNVAPLSIAAIKAAVVRSPAPLDEVLALEGMQQPMLIMTADHAEGRQAFAEKRKPNFQGR